MPSVVRGPSRVGQDFRRDRGQLISSSTGLSPVGSLARTPRVRLCLAAHKVHLPGNEARLAPTALLTRAHDDVRNQQPERLAMRRKCGTRSAPLKRGAGEG